MKNCLRIFFLSTFFTLGENLSVDFSFLEKGGGYTLDPVNITHDFAKCEFLVLRERSGEIFEIRGGLEEKLMRIEVIVIFSKSKPVAYSCKEWKKIIHPQISEEGETGEILKSVQSGSYDESISEIKNERLRNVIQQAVHMAKGK